MRQAYYEDMCDYQNDSEGKMDSRNKKFADLIVNYSCRVQKGEKVLIEEIGVSAAPLIKELIRAVYAA